MPVSWREDNYAEELTIFGEAGGLRWVSPSMQSPRGTSRGLALVSPFEGANIPRAAVRRRSDVLLPPPEGEGWDGGEAPGSPQRMRGTPASPSPWKGEGTFVTGVPASQDFADYDLRIGQTFASAPAHRALTRLGCGTCHPRLPPAKAGRPGPSRHARRPYTARHPLLEPFPASFT